jgi:hypothetical protein
MNSTTNTAPPRIGSNYQRLIRQLDPKKTVNPAGVEAMMRAQYGTLGHLDDATFRREIKLARQCEQQQPGFLRGSADSHGMTADFAEWEAA